MVVRRFFLRLTGPLAYRRLVLIALVVRRFFLRLTGPLAYRRLVLIALGAIYLNIVSGALVRVTNSGLGCPDWPLCEGKPTPPFQFHGLIEFTNRVVALAVIVVAILLAIAAWRSIRQQSKWLFRGSLSIGIITFMQGPLGGVTVLLDLHPIAVMSHFVLALIEFVIIVVLTLETFEVTPDWSPLPPRWLATGGILLTAWAWLVIISGAVVTMSGTHPGSDDVPRLWNLLDSAYLHVRVAASFVVVLGIFLVVLARVIRPPSVVTRFAWALVITITAQIVIGEWQWRTQLPWWLVLIHVTLGTLSLAITAGFGWTLVISRRPARRLR